MTEWNPENYKEPTTNIYLSNFELGNTTVRFLSAEEPTMGYEYWKDDEYGKPKPVRCHFFDQVDSSIIRVNPKTGEQDRPRYFWALPVWHFESESIKWLVIKQKTIRDAISLSWKNKKWGNPTTYNFVITRMDESGKTTYTVQTEPKEDLPKEIWDKYHALVVDGEAWIRGGEPFVTNAGQQLSDEENAEIMDSLLKGSSEKLEMELERQRLAEKVEQIKNA